VGGEYPCERAKESDFLFVCLEAEVSLRAMRPTSSDAKLMGGGWMAGWLLIGCAIRG